MSHTVYIVFNESLTSGSMDWYFNLEDATKAFEKEAKDVIRYPSMQLILSKLVVDQIEDREAVTKLILMQEDDLINAPLRTFPYQLKVWKQIRAMHDAEGMDEEVTMSEPETYSDRISELSVDIDAVITNAAAQSTDCHPDYSNKSMLNIEEHDIDIGGEEIIYIDDNGTCYNHRGYQFYLSCMALEDRAKVADSLAQ